MSEPDHYSIFSSFNAKNLGPLEVAKTFVPSDHFKALAKKNNAMLVGPRGSGKTTLLKMLQPLALSAWSHEKAQDYREGMGFLGVFVPSDISWSFQRQFALGQEDSEKILERCEYSAFATHVLKAITSTLMNLRAGEIECPRSIAGTAIDPKRELEVTRTLASLWGIQPRVLSFFGLKMGLLARLTAIRTLANQCALGTRTWSSLSENEAQITSPDVLSLIANSVEAISDSIGLRETPWALLFDELEIAPSEIVKQLIDALRASDGRVIYKLAMSPISTHEYSPAVNQFIAPSPGQDYEVISLWYPDRQGSADFCHALWEQMLKDKDLPKLSPQDVFGHSYNEQAGSSKFNSNSKSYKPGGAIERAFSQLAETDKSFANYLRRKKIDPKNISADEVSRDEVLRKVTPQVIFRNYFLRKQNFGRSRKIYTLPTGADQMFALTEGNPRIFIGLIGGLLDQLDVNKPRISVDRQARAVDEAADRFLAMLRTIPSAPVRLGSRSIAVDKLVTIVGEYFENQILGQEFQPDPALTVITPMLVDQELSLTMIKAVNAGALIYIPDNSASSFAKNLSKKRFRLNFLLAQKFRIPLRLGKEVALSMLIKQTGRGPISLSLFDEANR